jgi:hypothetical protein
MILQDISLRKIMSNKVGRPKVPKSKSKTVLRGALFASTEVKSVDLAIDKSGQDKSKWIREKLIEASTPYHKKFPVNCPDAKKKYDGEKVLFRIEIEGELKGYAGKFVVHKYFGDPAEYVSVDLPGLRFLHDPPNTQGYSFHLSQAHVDSIIPVSDPEASFEVQLPFLSRHYIPNASPYSPSA